MAANSTRTLIGSRNMPEINLGVDVSDLTARVALVDATGHVVSRGEAPLAGAKIDDAVRDAVKRAVSAAKPKARIGATGVAMPSAVDAVPPDVAVVLREVASRDTEVVPVAAGNAAAVAEQWIGAARGMKQ